MNKKLINALRDFYEITDSAWLFGATLLGCIRDNKIIDWDRDIDVGIDTKLVTDELLDGLSHKGFRIVSKYRFSDERMKQYIGELGSFGKIILMKNDTKIEMCCFKEGKNNKLYYASGTPRFFALPYDTVYPLMKRRFYDFTVTVPQNAEKQLEFVYGKDWKTPKKNWYFTKDHYLCRERTIIEFGEDDGTKWSQATGCKVINESV